MYLDVHDFEDAFLKYLLQSHSFEYNFHPVYLHSMKIWCETKFEVDLGVVKLKSV